MFRAFAVHGQPIKHSGLTNGKVRNIDHLLNLTLAFGPNLSHLQADQGAQLLFVPAQRHTNLTDDISPFGGGDSLPINKGLRGTVYHNFIVVKTGATDLSDTFAVDRGNRRKHGTFTRHPGTDAGSGFFSLEI